MANRVERRHDRIVVTRNGRRSFALISADDLEMLEEAVGIVRDDELVESLRRSLREAAEGEHLPLPAEF